MNTSMQPGRDAASSWRGLLRPLLGALLLLLGWGSAAPASAEGGILSTGRNLPITVHSGETLTIVDGGGVWVPQGFGSVAVIVESGGTLNMTGGSVSAWVHGVSVAGTATISGGSVVGATSGVTVNGGTVTISGGSVLASSYGAGLSVNGGSATVNGGSVSGYPWGVYVYSGTVTISGCNLAVVDSVLTGTLLDGTPINTLTGGQPLTFDPPQPLVTTEPASQTACAGNSVSFTAAATGLVSGAATVQWQVSSGWNIFTDIPGATDPTLTFTAAAEDDGKLYRAVFTDGCNPVTTSAASLTVQDATPPVVTLNGAEQLTVECHGSFTDPGATANSACFGSLPATVSFGSVNVNSPGTYKLTYTATDPSNNTGWANRWVTVADTIPPAITLNGPSSMTVDCRSAGSFSDPGATASDACAGSVAVTTSGTVDVTRPGTYTLTYNATDGTNAATPVTRTVTVVPVTDLSVAYKTSPSTVVTGSNLTYTIEVKNAGPQPAQGVVLTHPLPAGTSFVSATRSANIGTLTTPKGSSSTVSWSVGTLASGQSVTLTVVVKVNAKAGALLTNTASVSSSSPKDPNPGNNSASVVTSVVAKR